MVAYDRAVWRARGRGAPRNFPAADPGRDPFVLAREGGTWAEFVGDLRAWGQSTFPGDGGRPAASRAARAACAPARSGKRKRDESKVVTPPASLFPPTTNALDVVRAAAAGVDAARAAAAAAANPVPRADAVAILDALLAAQSEPAPHALAAIEAQARVVSLARGGEGGWVATALRQVAPLSPPPSPADWDLDHLPPRTSRTDGWGGAWGWCLGFLVGGGREAAGRYSGPRAAPDTVTHWRSHGRGVGGGAEGLAAQPPPRTPRLGVSRCPRSPATAPPRAGWRCWPPSWRQSGRASAPMRRAPTPRRAPPCSRRMKPRRAWRTTMS